MMDGIEVFMRFLRLLFLLIPTANCMAQCPAFEPLFANWPDPENVLSLTQKASVYQTTPIVFVDPDFKYYVVDYYDLNKDGEICWNEALQVTMVIYYDQPNVDLTGLETFHNLESLICYNDQLTSIPSLYYMSRLQDFRCNDNPLTNIPSLDNLTSLNTFHCFSTLITKLPDVSNLSNLQYFLCNANQLDAVPNVWQISNPSLYVFWVQGNYLDTDNCSEIHNVLDMGLSEFLWNPQVDEFGDPIYISCP